MLAPFLYRYGQAKYPVGNWKWTKLWLLDWEIQTIVTQTMGGFLSASPVEIVEAARMKADTKKDSGEDDA